MAEQPAGAAGWISVSGLFAFAELLVLLALWRKLGPQTTLVVLPFLLVPIVLLWLFERQMGEPLEPQGGAEQEDLPGRRPAATHNAVAHAAIRRSWQAAVVCAFFMFEPLWFWVMRFFVGFGVRSRPRGWAGVCEVGIPFLINTVGIVLSSYSMQLLWQVSRRETPLSRADTCGSSAAFVLNVLTILLFLSLVFELLFCLFAVLGRI